MSNGEFSGSPQVRTLSFHCKAEWVRSLVMELGSHMQCSHKKKKRKHTNGRQPHGEIICNIYDHILIFLIYKGLESIYKIRKTKQKKTL